jgi:hypothetical protein
MSSAPAPHLFNKNDSRAAQGAVRMRQLAEQAEIERLAEVEAMIQDLGHAPSFRERILIDELAALRVRVRNLRKIGRVRQAGIVQQQLFAAHERLFGGPA